MGVKCTKYCKCINCLNGKYDDDSTSSTPNIALSVVGTAKKETLEDTNKEKDQASAMRTLKKNLIVDSAMKIQGKKAASAIRIQEKNQASAMRTLEKNLVVDSAMRIKEKKAASAMMAKKLLEASTQDKQIKDSAEAVRLGRREQPEDGFGTYHELNLTDRLKSIKLKTDAQDEIFLEVNGSESKTEDYKINLVRGDQSIDFEFSSSQNKKRNDRGRSQEPDNVSFEGPKNLFG